MFIAADDPRILYSNGRIDFSDPKAPVLVYAGTTIEVRFKGKSIRPILTNHKHFCVNKMLYSVDFEAPKSFKLFDDEEQHAYPVGTDLDASEEHKLFLFKQMDGNHYVTFHGFEIEGEDAQLYAMKKEFPMQEGRRIEFYGDSVSSGEVCEATDYVGKLDPDGHDGAYTNAYYSFTNQTAMRLHAEMHDIAQGGMAFLDGIGFFHAPEHLGMESCYNKIQYDPYLGTVKPWDFTKWIPQVVVVGIGQNDAYPYDFMKEDYEGETAKAWRNHYATFVRTLRMHYPKAKIICLTTVMVHDAAWDKAIGEVVACLGDENVSQFLFSRVGVAAPGHPRIPDHEEMAQELSAYIEAMGESIWKN